MLYSININSSRMRYWAAAMNNVAENRFPMAVRNTLNNLAFKMKGTGGTQGYIEKRSRSEFDYRRNKTFIRKVTWAGKVKQTEVSRMQSWAGVYEASEMDIVARRLETQQTGGILRHNFIPTDSARVSGSENKQVSKRNKLDSVGRYIDVTRMAPHLRFKVLVNASKSKRPVLIKGRKSKKKFIAIPQSQMIIAKRKSGGYNRKDYKKIVKLKFVYRKVECKNVKLTKKRNFVDKAGKDAYRHFPEIWNKEIDKALKIN